MMDKCQADTLQHNARAIREAWAAAAAAMAPQIAAAFRPVADAIAAAAIPLAEALRKAAEDGQITSPPGENDP